MTRQQSVWFSAIFLIAMVTAVSVPFASVANAQERKFEASYTASSATELSVESGVGSVELIRYSGDTIEVEMVAEEAETSFFSDANLDAVELRAEQNGNRLDLVVPEQDNVKLTWRIKMPQVASVTIDLGIGEVIGEMDAADLDVDIGIGELDVILVGEVADVKADVGIGDVNIEGAMKQQKERAFISASGNAEGRAQARVNVDVGIGEANITIQ